MTPWQSRAMQREIQKELDSWGILNAEIEQQENLTSNIVDIVHEYAIEKENSHD